LLELARAERRQRDGDVRDVNRSSDPERLGLAAQLQLVKLGTQRQPVVDAAAWPRRVLPRRVQEAQLDRLPGAEVERAFTHVLQAHALERGAARRAIDGSSERPPAAGRRESHGGAEGLIEGIWVVGLDGRSVRERVVCCGRLRQGSVALGGL